MAIAITATRNALATQYAALAVYASLHTADPGTTGAATSEVTGGTYARVAITWGTAANGVITGTATINVPAGTTITHAGGASATTGATLVDRVAITSQPFASAGTYALTLTYTQT